MTRRSGIDSKESLHTPFRLGRTSCNRGDFQFFQEAFKLGWVLLAHQLLLQRIRFAGFASLLENAVTIMVECQEPSMALQHLLHEQIVPMRIFLFAKDPGNQFARSIVNGRKQAQPWAALSKPGVMAPINLDQHPFLRIAGSSATMLWLASFGLRHRCASCKIRCTLARDNTIPSRSSERANWLPILRDACGAPSVPILTRLILGYFHKLLYSLTTGHSSAGFICNILVAPGSRHVPLCHLVLRCMMHSGRPRGTSRGMEAGKKSDIVPRMIAR